MQITQDEYYMNIAIAVRKKANCLGAARWRRHRKGK
jgi:hypothetical protein